MGRTRAIRIERCFWGTVDEQALDQAVFGDRGGEGRPAAIRRLSVFAFRVSRYIRMLSSNEKKATFMTHESRFSQLLIFHLYNGSSIVLFVRFVLHLLLIASIKRNHILVMFESNGISCNYFHLLLTAEICKYVSRIRHLKFERFMLN